MARVVILSRLAISEVVIFGFVRIKRTILPPVFSELFSELLTEPFTELFILTAGLLGIVNLFSDSPVTRPVRP